MEETDEAKIEMVEPNTKVHTFSFTIVGKVVKCEVIKFKDSIFLWIGDKRCRTFGDLSLALMSRFSPHPISSKLMGQETDLTSNNLAIKLSKRLGKPVYVSFNLENDRLIVPLVNKKVTEEIQNNPQFF